MGKSDHLGVEARIIRAGKQYIFGTPKDAAIHKLEDAVTCMNKVTHDTDGIVVYDLDVEDTKVDCGALTPIQKMRAALILKEKQEK